MSKERSCWVAVLLVGLLCETTWAQQEETQVSVRVVPGLSLVRSVFGDDRPRGTTNVVMSIGAQLCASRSRERALVIEGTFWPTWPENPHFRGRYGGSDFAAGWRRGGQTYFRAGFGLTIFWPWPHRTSGTRDRGMAFGATLAVGRDLGDRGNVAFEGVARAAFARGLSFLSVGAQVPLGPCIK